MSLKHIFLCVAVLFFSFGMQAQPPVIVAFEQVSSDATSVTYALRFGGFTDMVSFQFAIRWNPDELTLNNTTLTTELPSFDENNLGQTEPGTIRTLWLDPNLIPRSLSSDTDIMVFEFLKSDDDHADPIFTDCPIPIEFVRTPTTLVPVLGDAVYACAQLTGSVTGQLSGDCTPGGVGLKGVGLTFSTLGGGPDYNAVSLDAGFFQAQIPPGDYIVALTTPAGSLWEPCINDIPVTIDSSGSNLNFVFQPALICPQTHVELSSPFLRRCFDSRYYLSYGNQGTAIASAAEIQVVLDSFLTYITSSVTPSNIDLVTNTLTFSAGDLEPGDAGTILIDVSVSCDTELGQMLCSDASITPDTLCGAAINWSGASLEARAICNGDSIRMIVENVSAFPMDVPTPVMVIEDDVIVFYEEVQLPPGGTIEETVFAGGSTYRVQANQPPNHPFGTQAFAVVEGCTAQGVSTFTTGFGTLFQTDPGVPHLSVHCTEVIGAFDPNDKLAEPKGYGPAGKIDPGTPMTYTIRFQNTGTDTAFRVFLIDTIQEGLDVRSLEIVGASHAYELDWLAQRVIQIDFPDIKLVDSTANEAESHGFFRYRLRQSPDAGVGQVLENYADIYFDFNAPVRTNTTSHLIDVDFLDVLSSTGYAQATPAQVTIEPHPVRSTSRLIVNGASGKQLTLQLYDGHGRLICSMPSDSGTFLVDAQDLSGGLYFYTVQGESLRLSGKCVIINK